jgi:hypothetical protein
VGLHLLLGVTWSGAQGHPTTISVEEIEPGQRGFGLSVFSGTEPERFEVEVIGVWQNLRPDISYILAKLSGHGLEASGVIAGMSGSPVYIEDRLAGAVAFSWPFSNEAIAGITPIGAMRRQSAVSIDAGTSPSGVVPVELSDLASGALPADLLIDRLRSLSSSPFGSARAGVQWNAVGFSSAVLELLSTGLGTVAAAGSAKEGLPSELAPGASVAGVLVDGDLRMAVTGTVTDREDDGVLAFGHHFMGLGSLQLPMATSSVVTVISSQQSSFKLANIGQVVGAFDMDRATGVRGKIGLHVSTLPLRITVESDPVHGFELEVARIQDFTPVLVAISSLAALEASSQTGGSQGLDMDARFSLKDDGILDIRQSFDGVSAPLQSAVYLLAYTGYLLNNPLKSVDLESVEVRLKQYANPRTISLVGAHAAQPSVYPGQTVPIHLDLAAYRGARSKRSLEIQVPPTAPAGRYSLLVGDGPSVDAARISFEKALPIDFDQALSFLRSLHSRNELVVLGIYGEEGISQSGEVMPHLPGSIKSIWRAANSSGAIPLGITVARQDVIDLERPLSGLVRIDLKVESKPRHELE